MIILLAVIFGIIVGWIGKGTLKNLESIKLKNLGFLIAGIILQIPLRFSLSFEGPLEKYLLGEHLYILSLALILITTFSNLNYTGIKILALGSSLNFIAITSNGGRMPVSIKAVEIAGILKDVQEAMKGEGWFHFILIERGKTLFPFLGDVIPLPLSGSFSRVVSIGDLFIFLGIFLFLYSSMRKAPVTYKP